MFSLNALHMAKKVSPRAARYTLLFGGYIIVAGSLGDPVIILRKVDDGIDNVQCFMYLLDFFLVNSKLRPCSSQRSQHNQLEIRRRSSNTQIAEYC